MDYFPDHQHVWLRSRVHGGYLHADKDGHGVSLGDKWESMKAAWVVHRYHGGNEHVLLHSVAYGRYLSATDASARVGLRGFRVEQRNYDDLEDDAIRWHPISTGDGYILLRHLAEGGRYGYLRANGRYIPWNNDVTVEDFTNISTMMQWFVEPIPSRERVPRLPRSITLRLFGRLTDLLPKRVIQFMGNGEACYNDNVSFTFRGRSVFRLRTELIRRLGISPDVSDNLVMYVRAGTHGRFTPLVANLSSCRQTLVITAQTPANGGPRHPDFDAEEELDIE